MGRREPPAGRLVPATYVGEVIPTGFPAYARILHPARRDPVGTRVRWAEVAEANGRIAHAEMQWEAITAGGEGRSFSGFDPPEPGRLPPEEARLLVELLRPFTAQAEEVEFAVWEGWGPPVPLVAVSGCKPGATPSLAPGRRLPGGAARLCCPDERNPLRCYLLYRGPLEAAVWLSERANGASLWWPADRSWCVATEVDFAWTYVLRRGIRGAGRRHPGGGTAGGAADGTRPPRGRRGGPAQRQRARRSVYRVSGRTPVDTKASTR
ncbi:MAG: hypothetical protein K6U89_05580 [Chloroflexi bacterium]|nr:hypothetical protein [Chloroflexota bacterium]